MNFNLTPIICIVFSVVFQSHAYGQQYRFNGTVTSVSSELTSEFGVGESVEGHMNLFSSTSSSDRAFYGVSSFSLLFGGDYLITEDARAAGFSVLNDFGGSIDSVGLNVYDPNAPFVSGHAPEYLTFNLLYDVDDLSSTQLLDEFIFNSPLDRSGLRFDGNDSIRVGFQLETLTSIPEPSSIPMFVIGIVILAGKRRRPLTAE